MRWLTEHAYLEQSVTGMDVLPTSPGRLIEPNESDTALSAPV
jgi:hypothetical protein